MQVIVRNLAVEYKDEGTGPVLLMLHGWQDNLKTFDALTKSLSNKFRIVRLDLPGFGGSQIPPTAWELNDYIELVQEFLKKLRLEITVLAGHSFGGRIAIKGIATQKLTAKKLILIGSAGLAKQNTLRNRVFGQIAKAGKIIFSLPLLSLLKAKIRKQFYTKIGSDYLNTGALKETYLKIIAEDLTENAEQILIPTLLIWGKNDTATPLADGQRFQTLIRNSRLEVIEDAGHFVHREKPQEVLKLFEQFV